MMDVLNNARIGRMRFQEVVMDFSIVHATVIMIVHKKTIAEHSRSWKCIIFCMRLNVGIKIVFSSCFKKYRCLMYSIFLNDTNV